MDCCGIDMGCCAVFGDFFFLFYDICHKMHSGIYCGLDILGLHGI